MLIDVQTKNSIVETKVNILCRQIDNEVDSIISTLQLLDRKLTGSIDGQTVVIDAANILYIDTTDKRTFLYSKDQVFQTTLRLYELDEKLSSIGFFRASKSSIVNFNHIQAIRADINERVIVTMSNGERLIVSRKYTGAIKNKLGVK